jgi:alpha-L-fucosidase
MAALLLAGGMSRSCFAQLEGDTIPVSTAHPVAAVQDKETPAERDARMKWWREARFGMLITWGVYSVPAGMWDGKQVPGIGEWIMNYASIPVADYKALAPQFNPTGYSAHDIVALAKTAGMKYIIAMPKHHDGFGMYDSKVDPFNIVDATPFKRDPLAELAEEWTSSWGFITRRTRTGPHLEAPRSYGAITTGRIITGTRRRMAISPRICIRNRFRS